MDYNYDVIMAHKFYEPYLWYNYGNSRIISKGNILAKIGSCGSLSRNDRINLAVESKRTGDVSVSSLL